MIDFMKIESPREIGKLILPSLRNQDCIRVRAPEDPDFFVLAVGDGWNLNPEINGNGPGLQVVEYVLAAFPQIYAQAGRATVEEKARVACTQTDVYIRKHFYEEASCVAAFLFHAVNSDVVISVGDPLIYVWDARRWVIPKGIGNHALSLKEHASNCSRFFGRDLQKNKEPGIYSANPDIAFIEVNQPVFMATDGLKDILTLDQFNQLGLDPAKYTAQQIIDEVAGHVKSNLDKQKDDIAVCVRTN